LRSLIAASKMLGANPKLVAALVASVALVSFEPAANALSYSTSGALGQGSLGDTLGTGFDTLDIQSASGTIDPGTTKITLNTLTFTAGVNATAPAVYNGIFSFAETMMIGSGSGTLTVPFNLSINYSDTLTIVGGAALSILVGADLYHIVVNGLALGPNSGGALTGSLTAQVSESPAATPLPAALVLFGSGLAAMGLFGRRRKLKGSSVLDA
jgi:hypothetical protein